MKETVKTSRTAGYLEKMFRALNRDWFGGELEEPIITIQSTPRAYGHVTVGKTWKRKDDWRHELNMGAETINRPIEEVVATMVHEMVHLWNIAHEVQDCSRGGMYHNRKFRDEAQRRGLVIGHHEVYGWTITSPSDELLEYILEQGWTEINISRGGFGWVPPKSGGSKAGDGSSAEGEDKPKPKKSSTRKLQCPCCGNSVRATKAVRIMCMDCEKQMQEV